MTARTWLYVVGTLAAFYLAGAFIAWELNPALWNWGFRALMALIASLCALPVAMEVR